MNMNTLEQLQNWYQAQCNGDWEHGAGIKIGTLDNPGWRVKIPLRETGVESKPFEEISNLELEDDWLRCWVEDAFFNGVGDPQKLEVILQTFLAWSQNKDA